MLVLAGLTRLLISTEEEYPVIGSGRHREGHQQINGKRREYNDIVIAEKRDDSPGRKYFDPNRDQQQNHGDDRTVDEKQYHEDYHGAYHGHLQNGSVTAAAAYPK